MEVGKRHYRVTGDLTIAGNTHPSWNSSSVSTSSVIGALVRKAEKPAESAAPA